MTTIIISILAALGIGGGVMLASSGGGSSSGGTAIVGDVNPGGSGGSYSGGSNTGGTGGEIGGGSSGGGSTGGGSNTGGAGGEIGGGNTGGAGGEIGGGSSGGGSTGGGSGSVIAGVLLSGGSSSNITTLGFVAKNNTSLESNILTIGLAPFVPILESGTTYKTVTNYVNHRRKGYWGYEDAKFLKNYGTTSTLSVSFDLTNRTAETAKADFYQGPSQTKTLETLRTNYLDSYEIFNNTFTNVTWSFNSTLALGGRNFNLHNSDFGYVKWQSSLDGVPSDLYTHYVRFGAQAVYMFDKSKQLLVADYSRYSNNLAEFSGNVIGHHYTYNFNCGQKTSGDITGNITLSINFNNTNLPVTGTLTNMKIGSNSWYNFGLEGTLNNVTTIGTNNANFNITKITYEKTQTPSIEASIRFDDDNALMYLNDTNFGNGVIVIGNSPSEDELVGQISFVAHQNRAQSGGNVYMYENLAFGAINQPNNQ